MGPLEPANGQITAPDAPAVAISRPFSTKTSDFTFDGYPPMRMLPPSASFQPCSSFSCIAETRKRPSGLKATSTWLPAHFSICGFCSAIPAYQSATPP